jgi:hypothetical protein
MSVQEELENLATAVIARYPEDPCGHVEARLVTARADNDPDSVALWMDVRTILKAWLLDGGK